MSNIIETSSPYLAIIDYENMNAQDQTLVQALIEASTSAIEKECRRIFGAANYVEVQDGNRENFLFVHNYPINSLTSIVIKVDDTGDNDITLTSTALTYCSETGEIRWDKLTADVTDYLGYFPEGFQNITIRYNGGFSEIPTPIQQVCAQIVIQLYKREDADYQVKQDKMDNHYISFNENAILLPHKRVLNLYKSRRLRI